MKQEFTSKNSSVKQLPAGFSIVDKHFGWQPNTINLDIGGGKYNIMTEKLLEKNVINYIYDPFNRDEQYNTNSLNHCINGKSDTVTIFNVLNVIKEYEIQIGVLMLAFNALKPDGMLYVRSTYKNPNKISGVTKSDTFQHYLKQNEYLEIVKQVFPNARLMFGIIFSKK